MSGPGKLPMTDVCPSCGVVYRTTQGHSCGRGTSRVRAFLASLAGWLFIQVRGGHVRRCACPLCNQVERQMREAMGVPLRHPERVARDLPGDQEEQLAALAEELWPHDEYAAIVTNPWQGD